MEVILADDVLNLGDIGEKVRVKPGYARNFLIPRGLAIEVGSRNASLIEHKMRAIEAKKKLLKVQAEELSESIRNLTVELELRVGDGGKVFGSISSRDIASKVTELGVELDRRRILLEEPIKKIGTHFVTVKLHPEVKCQLKLVVNWKEATEEQKKAAAEAMKAAVEEAHQQKQEDSESEEVVDESVEEA